MKTATEYLWFTTAQRQEFVRITDEEMRNAVDQMTQLALRTATGHQ